MDKFTKGISTKKALDAYVPLYELNKSERKINLGKNTTRIVLTDPRLLLFTLSKYKFAAKMINSESKVLEVGCMDGFTSLFLSKYVKELVSVDFFEEHIKHAIENFDFIKNLQFKKLDFLNSPYIEEFEAIVSFDVLEHIDPSQSDIFIENCYKALKTGGICIIGMPSLESQAYASEVNKKAHINCMSVNNAKILFNKFFIQILNFSMNDEIVHTGYDKLAHYNIYLMIK